MRNEQKKLVTIKARVNEVRGVKVKLASKTYTCFEAFKFKRHLGKYITVRAIYDKGINSLEDVTISW